MPKKTLGFCGTICTLLCGATAATCAAGYYLENGECSKCLIGPAYYCPGDDTRHPCPPDTTNWPKILADYGISVISIDAESGIAAWASSQGPITGTDNCYMDRYFTAVNGSALIEQPYNGTDYHSRNDLFHWYAAGTGYYLSPYWYSTGNNWYYGTKPCTNAPAHAHYTGAGTPDSPDGTITDTNDCPWECDDGYGRVGDTCEPLCATGITHIHAGTATAPLFPVKYTSPALAVRTAGGICYGNLTAGHATGINITINGTTYHLE